MLAPENRFWISRVMRGRGVHILELWLKMCTICITITDVVI